MHLQDNEQLNQVVQSAPIGICILDAVTFEAELLNDKFLEIAGKPKEAIIGKWYWEPFAEARATYESVLKNVAQTGEAFHANEAELMLIRHGEEEMIFVTFVYAPVLNTAGEVTKIAVWVFENTRQVKERRAIIASEERLRALITASSDVIYSLSADWEIMRELDGRGFLKDTHKPISGWRTQNVHPDDMEIVNATIAEAILKKQIFQLEHKVLRADGSPGWTFSRAVPILDERGDIVEWLGTAADITERKRIENALREAREQADKQKRVYEAITSGTPDLMYVWDLDYRFTYVNSALLAMWGKTWDTAIGKGLRENGYEEWHAAMHEREIDEVRATKKAVRGEVAFPHATLGKRTYDYILIPVLDEAGVVEAVAGTTRDITERKLWEEKLAQASEELQAINEEMVAVNEEQAASNEELIVTNEELTAVQQRLETTNHELEASSSRLRMAIESTRLGTWDFDPRSGALYWSKECHEIYGLPLDQTPTFATFSEHIYPADHDWVQQQIQDAISPEKGGHYELSFRIIRFGDRQIRWIKVHGTVYFDQGEAVRFIGTVLDITDIKAAEEQSAKLAAIIQSSDDAIISKTFESKITSWNAAAERIFGYKAEEMIGESIYKLIPEELHFEEPQILERLGSGKRVQHFETKRRTKDGRLIDVSLTISPVKDSRGNIIGLSKIARDITEKKLDENRKSDFIGMVSHELKTPLTSLSAIIQVTNAKLKTSGDSFLINAMEKANQQVKRMATMINGFLNISRLESGKIHIEKQPFDIGTLIADMIDEASLTARTDLIRFTRCPSITVNADRDKIGSVISNLISNAIKYSPTAASVEITCATSDGQVIVSVRDEGMGIKPEDLGKIFDRYYRVEDTHTRHIAGFGIGLYLSSEIVQRHGGKVWAESQPGVGSTFYFSLPLETD
ncbi:PAS domain S-box protein [Mucilaginibacter sp. SMC90]|uniref:PAS domain S-box protein n=1 Tax=Mucilaginibacter sp. SMC90 TaxID=2929803 RepID=UPI001FB26C8A|nr:PAS domain S-box protein [Mucilaginibacter sp. SMC90]UOE47470.1 PAS domain S-box protein [Mucilaginibacter sp. SMC90]